MTVSEVVVGVDGSEGSAAALDWALHEAASRGTALRALFAYQRPPGPAVRHPDGLRAEELVRSALSNAVSAAVRRTGSAGVAVTVEPVEGHPVGVLVEASGPAALVVTGARGRGPLRGLLLGSVSQSVAHHARGPLVVVPPPGESAPRAASPHGDGPRVVVGVDGSQACVAALRFAADAARRADAVLHVVHAWLGTVSGYGGPLWESPRTTLVEEARAALDTSVRALGNTGGLDVRAETAEGLEYGVLLDAARGADLLVVGSRGRGGWRGLLLGSVGLHCVAASPCPVAVIRPD